VGIGTSSPSNARLTLTGTDGANPAGLYLNNTTATNGKSYSVTSGNSGEFMLYDRTSSAYRLFVNSLGNVGVGTSSPASLLHLASNAPYITFEDKDNNQDWQIQATAWFAIRDQTNSAERMRIDAAGHAIIGGGVTLGNGQTYSAANTLDDYEEGTWTPTGSSFTVATIYSAKYTKIGQQVTVVAYINASSGTGNPATIGGLPFTSTSSGYSVAGVNITAANPLMYNLQLRVGTSSTDMVFQQNNDNSVAGTSVDSGHIIFTATYFTDS
jgi:hypothetical protein